MGHKKQPDNLAEFHGHAIVGLGVAWFVAKAVKSTAPGIVAGVIALGAHLCFDTLVSQGLSDLGV
jgi:hypothetical protein